MLKYIFNENMKKTNQYLCHRMAGDKLIVGVVTLLLMLSLIIMTFVPVQKAYATEEDISGSFTDPYFKQIVWNWLGNSGEPGSFTKQDLIVQVSVYNNYLLAINNENITSLDGLENFQGTGLKELYCTDCINLSSLPELPDSLTSLTCRGNQLTYLPDLPTGLTYLDCSYNQIDYLPSLPDQLEFIDCRSNALLSMPDLPDSLITFNCSNNNLTEMPSLPSSLESICCSENMLTVLPELPPSLKSIACQSNDQLSSIPDLPTSLIFFVCDNCILSNLPQLPDGLTYLSCNNNRLSNLPQLPDELAELYCYSNVLTTLPDLPDSLKYLDCRNNRLSSLPALPNNLEWIKGSRNYINVFSGSVKDTLDQSDASKYVSPQYKVEFNQTPPMLRSIGATWQLDKNMFDQKQTDDGQNFTSGGGLPLHDFVFSSSDSVVVTVDANGLITAQGDGTCNIYILLYGIDSEYTKITIPMIVQTTGQTDDISDSFTDPCFKQAVWEWLGNTGEPSSFTKQDLINRMEIKDFVLNVSNRKISVLNGIENFSGTGIRELNCSSNWLNDIPLLPDGLTKLYCGGNGLTTLPNLPDSLTYLDCGESFELTTLPNLPDNLIYLDCHSNQLTALPNLPASLTYLDCGANQLRVLPNLPDYLTYLYCADNCLVELPTLPNGSEIYCNGNRLSSLPRLPANLKTLFISSNYINTWADSFVYNIENCSIETLEYLGQLRWSYTGVGLALLQSSTKQISDGEIIRQESYDGTTWTDSNSAGGQVAIPLYMCTFFSSDSNVATVDDNGLVTSHNNGQCEIYVLYSGIDSEYTKVTIPVLVSERFATLIPYSAVEGYDETQITVNGTNTTFLSAYTTLKIKDKDQNDVTGTSTVRVVDKTHAVITLKPGLLSSGSPFTVTLSTRSETISATLRLDAAPIPEITIDPARLVQGYSNAQIAVNGYNTHFQNGITTMAIRDKSNQDITGQSNVSVTDITHATITLQSGLVKTNSPYTVSLNTGNETVSATLTISSASSSGGGGGGGNLVLQNPPKISQFIPDKDSSKVAVDAEVKAVFDQDVTVVNLSGIKIKDKNNALVTGVKASLSGKTITIEHANLSPNNVYTVTIPTLAVKNSANQVNEETSWTFSTGDLQVSIKFETPTNGQTLKLGDTVQLAAKGSGVSYVMFYARKKDEHSVEPSKILDFTISPSQGSMGQQFIINVVIQNKPQTLFMQYKNPGGSWASESICQNDPRFNFDVDSGKLGENNIYTYSKTVTIGSPGLDSEGYNRYFKVHADNLSGGDEKQVSVVVQPQQLICVYVNTQLLKFDTNPFISSGTLMVPMRELCNALGIDVSWDNETKRAIAGKNGTTIEFVVGSISGIVDGESISMNQSAVLKGETVFIPLRFICDALGLSIQWDEQSKSVNITQKVDHLEIKNIIFNKDTYVQNDELILIVDVAGNPKEVLLKIPDLNLTSPLYKVFGWEWATYGFDLTKVGSLDYTIEAFVEGTHTERAGTVIVDSIPSE